MKQLYLFLFFVCFAALGHAQHAPGQKDIDGLKVYPNPVTTGKVYIQTDENAPKKIMIFDVFGTQVLETALLGRELNVSQLDAGVYMMRVMENDRVATRKLIVK